MRTDLESDRLAAMMSAATQEVFAKMLELDAVGGEFHLDPSPPSPAEGVLALVGLAGAWMGTGTFACGSDTARALAGRLLQQDFPAIDEEVLDALGEFANMVFGNVKTMLEEELGPMGLSIPTVIFGRNFNTRSVGRRNWIVVPFRCGDEPFEVRLCLVPNQKSHSLQRVSPALSVVG